MKTVVRRLLAIFVVGFLVLVVGIALSGSPWRHDHEGDEGPDSTLIPPHSDPRPLSPGDYSVSYSDASEWLEDLEALEREDQIRDWTVLGLAALLDLDAEALRDYAYDKAPLRDPLLADLTTNQVGPGRSLFDSRGLLHLLVPERDPYESRTIALLLDDHRKDSGLDEPQVQLHRYRIDAGKHQVALRTEKPQPTPQVRLDRGYRETRIDQPDGLETFLAETRHLSRVWVRNDSQLWAAGWTWPGTPGGEITAEDLAILQQGYERAALGLESEPGFSLDPGAPVGDLEAVARLLRDAGYPDAEAFTEEYEMLMNDFEIALESASQDPTFALDEEKQARIAEEIGTSFEKLGTDYPKYGKFVGILLGDKPLYQYARYDGGLRGTEAGMTFFYTDLVAKAWPMEVGTGSPTGTVPGFVSDLDARTPWSHCSTMDESGRLWFGLREEGMTPHTDRVELGSQVTRLFSRIEDPEAPDREIEPSYRFGRIMWWWDQHYQLMADYEPQYHRLDQLMRWGAVLSWLSDRGDLALPVPAASEALRNLRFADWLSQNSDLRWSHDLPWVNPEGLETEALLVLWSDNYEDCGSSGIFWSGGISGPGLQRVAQMRDQLPRLNARVARGGLTREATDFSAATRSGSIGTDTIRRTLGAVESNAARVDVTASGRKVWPLGRLKAWVAESSPRRLRLDISASLGRLRQRLVVQDLEVGALTVEAESRVATVTWRPGVLGRARRGLAAVEDALARQRPLGEAAAQAEGASLTFFDREAGRAFLRFDSDSGGRWIALEKGLPEAGQDLALRLGAPGEGGAPVTWFGARFTGPPRIPPVDGGGSGGWLSSPPGGGSGPGGLGKPVRLAVARRPDDGAEVLPTRLVGEDRRGLLYLERDRVTVKADDPVFGLDGTVEGAAMLEPAVGNRVAAARRAAIEDGYARTFSLDNGSLALVEGRELTLVRPQDPWHARLRAALDGEGSARELLVKVQDDGQALIVERPRVVSLGQAQEALDLGDFLRRYGAESNPNSIRGPPGPPLYLERRFAATLEESNLVAGAPQREWRVRVVRMAEAPGGGSPPDILVWDGGEWFAGGGGVDSVRAAGLDVARLVYAASDCEEDEERLERCSD
ncbi:MAG TPA: hypothetical protein VNB06_23750 [Thermoanaerobaculia bacterium]|nr:hypothetical protein [Thermoanaerobaculia bacterium]